MTGIETALAAAAIKEVASPIGKVMARLGRETFDEWTAKFLSTFQGHVDTTIEKCSQVKNIIYLSRAVNFDSHYVSMNFSHENLHFSDKEILQRAISREKVLISGTAGAGKTMFMRWCALRLIETMASHGRIPLFIELRKAGKSLSKETLEKYIFENTSSAKDSSNFAQFTNALEAGVFVVILDAIDEIPPANRADSIAAILNFVQKYPKCSFIASTRPEERLEAVQEFSVYHSTAMTLEQIIEVIDKLEHDREKQDALIEKLRGGLFARLSEFLSNPLLATIMLIAFDHGGDVPERLTSFYRQAFEALYQRHDASKGAYRREQYANLSLDEFQRVLSIFCFESYMEFNFRFTDSDLLERFDDALNYEGITSSANAVVDDVKESLCMIVRDGWDNVFAHRSFQEYFSALFISRYREGPVRPIIDKLFAMESRSGVAAMLYELDPELVDYEWLLPLLDEIIEKFGRVRPRTKAGLTKLFAGFAPSLYVSLETGKVVMVGWNSLRKESGDFGAIISAAQSAMGDRNLGFRELFGGYAWTNLDDFLSTVPAHLRPDEEYIVSRTEDDHPRQRADEDLGPYIELSSQDVPWLLGSDVPEIFRAVIQRLRVVRAEITVRKSERAGSMKELLKKPRARRFSRP